MRPRTINASRPTNTPFLPVQPIPDPSSPSGRHYRTNTDSSQQEESLALPSFYTTAQQDGYQSDMEARQSNFSANRHVNENADLKRRNVAGITDHSGRSPRPQDDDKFDEKRALDEQFRETATRGTRADGTFAYDALGPHQKFTSRYRLPPREPYLPPPKNIVRQLFAFGDFAITHTGPQKEFVQQNSEHTWALFYTILSLFTRLYRIGAENSVVWDEAHFGKFGSYYLNRDFYFDVHPPLGKMLVALVGLLSFYDGSFDFKSGADYPETLPYTSMRVMLALFGVALVPIGWYTASALGFTRRGCHLVAMMVLFGKYFHRDMSLAQTLTFSAHQIWRGTPSAALYCLTPCYFSLRHSPPCV